MIIEVFPYIILFNFCPNQGCDCAANWLILANYDPNFVISEISVNQVRKCFHAWGMGDFAAVEQSLKCYCCKRFRCILANFALGQSHPCPTLNQPNLIARQILLIYSNQGRNVNFGSKTQYFTPDGGLNLHVFRRWKIPSLTTFTGLNDQSRSGKPPQYKVCSSPLTSFWKQRFRLRQIESVFPVILSSENLASQLKKKTTPRKKKRMLNIGYMW